MRIIRESTLQKMLKEAHEQGLSLAKECHTIGVNQGYELGWQMRRVERDNRGFIIPGSRLNQDLEEILKQEGV